MAGDYQVPFYRSTVQSTELTPIMALVLPRSLQRFPFGFLFIGWHMWYFKKECRRLQVLPSYSERVALWQASDSAGRL